MEVFVASIFYWRATPLTNRRLEAMEDHLWEQVERTADKVAMCEGARDSSALKNDGI
jgi:hypothetical protein